jgi:Plasmid pRiA4b ORF-3-like protein
MKQASFICTPEQIQILQAQQFTDTQPGTLLKDFNTLLDFVGETGIAVTEKAQLLAMNKLAELNQRLSRPLDVKLKRPQQKAYPHINGLYLLLRCSGLTHLDGDGKKAKLMLDKKMLAKWHELNPTEQYFSLLQAFFYRATSEIIADHSGFGGESCFFKCLDFYQQHLQKDFGDTKNRHPYTSFLFYAPGLHNLALMKFFGFITVECETNNETETWSIAKVKSTDVGHAILGYFAQCNRSYLLSIMFGDDEGITGSWEDGFKKALPAWQKSLLPDNNKAIAAQQEGCYIFNVTLEKASCKLGVPANLSLDELAHGILDAFDFDDHDHLYEFIFKNQYGIEDRIAHPYGDSDYEFASDECSVGYLPLYKGMMITFWFDFGDDWIFKIQVAQMPSPELHFDDLTVIEKKGTPPKQYPDWDEDDE